jgi:hypothetical protein
MAHFSPSEAQPPTPWVDQNLPERYVQDDPEQASWAGVVDYYLHGHDACHGRSEPSIWIVDVKFGDAILDRFPSERVSALQHRLFLHRAVRYMSAEGIKQFIDIGSGLVDPYSTHRVLETLAQEKGIQPDARTCYVDNTSTTAARVLVHFDRMGRPRRNTAVEGDLRCHMSRTKAAFRTILPPLNCWKVFEMPTTARPSAGSRGAPGPK